MLKINNPHYEESFLWSPDGQTTQTISVNPTTTQNYSVVYTLNGCESLSQNSTVTVNENPTNGVFISQNVLTSDQTGASYQWVNCLTGNSAISGETNQTFTAMIDGEFAVIVSLNGCETTSDCIVIKTSSLIDLDTNSGIEIFPNPAENEINLLLNSTFIGAKLIITDTKGKELKYLTALSNELQIDISTLTPGIYFICASEKNSLRARFLKL